MGKLRPTLVAAAGVATLLATGCSQTSSETPNPALAPGLVAIALSTPASTPAPTPAPTPPPPGLPVFYISHPGDRGLTAIDDQGHPAGVVVLPSDIGVQPSPDGSAYITSDSRVLDQSGSMLARIPDRARSWWADDSRHLCVTAFRPESITGKATSQTLELVTLGAGTRLVATLTGDVSSDSGFTVLACSPGADRVVVAHTVCCATDSLTVLQLSTGRVLYHLEDHAPNSALYVSSSIDGRYITADTWPEARQAAESTTCQVRDSSSGRIVSAVFKGYCRGFSADGHRVILASDSMAGSARFRLLNWATGQVVWTSDSNSVWILPRPRHRSLYIAGWRYVATGNAGGAYGDISFLRDDGTPVHVTSDAFFSAP